MIISVVIYTSASDTMLLIPLQPYVPLCCISSLTSSKLCRTRPIHIERMSKVCQMCLVDAGAISPLSTLSLRLEVAGAGTHECVVGTHGVPLPERVARRGLIPVTHGREVGNTIIFIWTQERKDGQLLVTCHGADHTTAQVCKLVQNCLFLVGVFNGIHSRVDRKYLVVEGLDARKLVSVAWT